MNKDDVLRAYSELSPEDQETVRAEIMNQGLPREAREAARCCCTDAMKAQLANMLMVMDDSDDPLAMCSEMLRLCQERVKEKCCCE